MSNENGLATAADFRKAADFDPPERVHLPKLDRDVLLKRPRPLWFLMRGEAPVTMSSNLESGDKKAKAEGVREAARWFFEVIQAVMVQPRCSMNPKDGEISPDLIDMEDANFIVKWAYGGILTEEGTEAQSLDTFRTVGKPVGAGAPQ